MKALPMTRAGFILLAFALMAVPARGQARPADDNHAKGDAAVNRLDIFNGPVRSVHYYTKGLTASEKVALDDLEQAENDLGQARYRRSMPAETRGMEGAGAYPVFVAPPLYFGDLLPAYLSNLNYALSDSAPVFPFALGYPGYPAALPYTGWGYYGFPSPAAYTGGYYGRYIPAAAPLGPQVLNVGGDRTRPAAEDRDGGEKSEVSVAQARRRLEAARARVNRSERLRTALNLPKRETPAAEDRETATNVTVTMKNGTTHKGKLVRETKDTLVVASDNKEIEIRRSETASVTREKAKKNP